MTEIENILTTPNSVLRPTDFDSFNIDETFELIGRIAEAVSVL
jgi:hypothetical protein